jgi:hypothetical protein
MQKRKKPAQSPCERDDVPRADVTLRLPVWMLDRIRSVAADCGIPCENVIKVWVAEKVLSREKAWRQREPNARR